jgi:hypothetical protein
MHRVDPTKRETVPRLSARRWRLGFAFAGLLGLVVIVNLLNTRRDRPKLPVTFVGYQTAANGIRMGVFHVTNIFSRAVDFSPAVQTKRGTNWVGVDGVVWPAPYNLAPHGQTKFMQIVPASTLATDVSEKRHDLTEGVTTGQTWRVAILYQKTPTAFDEFTFQLRTLCFRFHLNAIGKRVPTSKWMFRDSYSREISEVDF